MSIPAYVLTEPAASTLLALGVRDIAYLPEAQSLWRRTSGRSAKSEKPAPPLPVGHASPMGFWLSEEVIGASIGSRVIRVSSGETSPLATAPIESRGAPSRRSLLSARFKSPAAGEGEVVLTVTPDEALVIANEAAWTSFSEPLLLAICQCWRFHTIDDALDRLTAEAHGDLEHATMSVLSTFRDRTRLRREAKHVREILLDQAHFAGPLTDPYAYLKGEKQVAAYRTLAEKLHLEEWSESIDERFECVEDTYASITEKLCEYRNFVCGATLEILIVAILVIDLFVNFLTWWES